MTIKPSQETKGKVDKHYVMKFLMETVNKLLYFRSGHVMTSSTTRSGHYVGTNTP